MKDGDKTKKELISELTDLPHSLSKSERSKARLRLVKKLLEENEKRCRTFYEETPIACFSIDSDGYIKMANKTTAALLGYTSEELNDRQMLDMCVDTSIRKAQEIFMLVQAGKEIHGEELEMRRADDSHVYVKAWVKPIRDRGRIIGSRYAVIDITDFKLAQEELALAEQNFRNSLDNSSLGICIVTADGELLYANQAILDIYCYSGIEELKAIPVKQRYTRQSYAEHKERKERRKRGEPITNYDISIVRRDGEIRHLSVSRKAVVWNGELQFLSTYQDITESKRAEEEVRKFKTVADSANYGVALSNLDGTFSYVNPYFAVMHGYTPDELINNSFDILYNDDELNKVNRMRNKLIKDGISFAAELWRKKKDGTVFPTFTTNSIITDDLGKPFFIAATAIDITERKQLEQEHQKIDKLESVGTLAGGIAHDFNNLLTGIMGNIELARRHVETGNVEKASNRLEEAEKASLQARNLTHQLLTFSRGGTPVKKTVLIAELLRESATFATRGSNIRCEFSIPDDLWLVDIDEGQMNQVITNLVINADEAMPEGGILNINAMNTVVEEGSSLPLNKGKYVVITIKDHGVGMKKEHLARIFEPYFTTKQKGSGLGLATAYSIIKNHGGYITVESKLGVGTTVYIYLPVSRKRLTVEKKEEVVKPSLFARGRILVMDDEEIVREFLHAELTDIGYEVELASDGVKAVEQYANAKATGQPYDAVILDLTVPGGMGGRETIKKLLEIDPDVKAIVSSGYATNPIMSDFRDEGFSAVVVKPYQLGELERTLRDIITGTGK